MAVLKLLRNQTLYATHEAALTAIDQMANNLHDGELWVATYGTSPNAKSILALKRTDGLTIFDNETSSDAITAVINALDATVKDGLDSVDDTQVAEGKHVGVKVVETDGVLTSISVVEKDIVSKDALDAEIAARKAVDGQTGDTYAKNTSANYIAEATSLNDADVKLDAALKTADDAMLTGVTGSNAITVSAKTNKNQTISLKLDDRTKPAGFTNADNVLSITSEGLYLSSIIDCGTYE